MERWDLVAKGGIGAAGGLVSYLFGVWTELFSFFLFTIFIDYVTGMGASLKEGKGLSSSIGFWGLAKKGLMLLVIIMAHRLDVLLGSDVVMIGAIYFYLANELISITENYGRLGLPLPNKIREIISIFKSKGEGGQR